MKGCWALWFLSAQEDDHLALIGDLQRQAGLRKRRDPFKGVLFEGRAPLRAPLRI